MQGSQIYKCELCDKEYSSLLGYKYHNSVAHKPSPPASSSPSDLDTVVSDSVEAGSKKSCLLGYVAPRKAAITANSRMASVVKNILKEKGDVVVGPRVDYISLNEQLKTNGQVQCPLEVSVW